jgi:hypothetical protein
VSLCVRLAGRHRAMTARGDLWRQLAITLAIELRKYLIRKGLTVVCEKLMISRGVCAVQGRIRRKLERRDGSGRVVK